MPRKKADVVKEMRRFSMTEDFESIVKAIITDYHQKMKMAFLLGDPLPDEDPMVEINEAVNNLEKELVDDIRESEKDFKHLLNCLKEIDEDDFDVDLLYSTLGEDQREALRDLLLEDGDLLYIEVKSMEKQEKLRQFIETEIAPLYNDQRHIITNIL